VHTQRAKAVILETVDRRVAVQGLARGVAGRALGEEHLVHGFLMSSANPGEALINTSDAVLGNRFENQVITTLPVYQRNVANLLSLQPALTVDGRVQFSLSPGSTANNESSITVANSLHSINLRLGLKSTAKHTEYRAAIETAGGRPVTSIHWTESFMPARNSVDTPEIPASELPSGEYMLLLSGKESNGSFVRVAEYSFRVIRKQ
jgi:hypothetical protein